MVYINTQRESKAREIEFLKIVAENPSKKENNLRTFIGFQKFYFCRSLLGDSYEEVKSFLNNIFLLENERVDYNKSEQFRGGPSLVHFALMCCDNLAARTAFLKWSYDKEHRGRHIVSFLSPDFISRFLMI